MILDFKSQVSQFTFYIVIFSLSVVMIHGRYMRQAFELGLRPKVLYSTKFCMWCRNSLRAAKANPQVVSVVVAHMWRSTCANHLRSGQHLEDQRRMAKRGIPFNIRHVSREQALISEVAEYSVQQCKGRCDMSM